MTPSQLINLAEILIAGIAFQYNIPRSEFNHFRIYCAQKLVNNNRMGATLQDFTEDSLILKEYAVEFIKKLKYNNDFDKLLE